MYKTRIAWSDFFETSNPTTLTNQEYTSRQTPTGSGVYVTNCFFKNCTSSGNGGALYCTSQYLLVETTTFFSCKGSSQYGGSIYFFNSSGKCVLYRICAYDCCSTYSGTSYGQIAHIELSNIGICKTYLNYSSFSCCASTYSNTHRTLNFINGNVYCPSVNCSMSKCQYASGFYYYNSGASSFTHFLSYSTFADNIAMGHNCIMYDNVGNRCDIKYCNILRNIQNSYSYGIIYSDKNLIIENSCILGNQATCTFFQARSSYRTTLSNCTVDSTSNNGYLTIQNTVRQSFIHELSHMSTQNCRAEYGAFGTLTPITPQNNKLCYTCKNNHARINEFFSLNCVFMVSLIHPDPSN
jgi:hypothetical protein